MAQGRHSGGRHLGWQGRRVAGGVPEGGNARGESGQSPTAVPGSESRRRVLQGITSRSSVTHCLAFSSPCIAVASAFCLSHMPCCGEPLT
jgi:hypothetical protein